MSNVEFKMVKAGESFKANSDTILLAITREEYNRIAKTVTVPDEAGKAFTKGADLSLSGLSFSVPAEDGTDVNVKYSISGTIRGRLDVKAPKKPSQTAKILEILGRMDTRLVAMEHKVKETERRLMALPEAK